MLQGNPTKPQIHRATIETDELPAPWSSYAHATAEAAALTAFEVPTFLDSLVPASLIPDVERLLHVSPGHKDTLVRLCYLLRDIPWHAFFQLHFVEGLCHQAP